MKYILHIILCSILATFSTQFHIVKIGAIFFADESNLEHAFDAAIENINQLELPIRLAVVKHYLNDDDSIILQHYACDFIANGVAAIFGPSSNANSDIVEILCNITGIPHLQFDWYNTAETPHGHQHHHQLTVNVAPTDAHLGDGILDILRSEYFNWKSFTIVYERDARLTRLQPLFTWKPIHKTGIKLFEFTRGDDYRSLWKTISNTREKYVLLDCPYDIVRDVINATRDFNMNEQLNNYFLIDLDTHIGGLEDLYSEEFSAFTAAIRVRSYIPAPVHDELDVFEDQEEDQIVAIRSQLIYDSVLLYFNAVRRVVQRERYFEPQRLRCGFGYWRTGPRILNEMQKISWKNATPPFKTQKLSINKYGKRDDFNLDIYNPFTKHVTYVWNKQHRIVPFAKIAENATKKAQARDEETKEDYSQRRMVYTVATRIGEPYVMWRPEPEGMHYEGNERFEGYAVDLIYKLAEECRFDFKFEIVSDNSYGSYNPITDEWNGIIRQLIDNTAQIGICDLTITHARRQVVDFTVPFMQLGISIVHYKIPPPEKNLWAFFKPFAFEVWIYLLVAIMILSFMLVVLARFSRPEWKDTGETVGEAIVVENNWHLRNTMWLIVGSILNAGCDILPRGGPMRTLTAFWWIFAMLMSQTYLAKLASFITTQKMEGSIRNLHDLVQQNKVQFGTVKGGSTSLYFSESNDSDYRVAWNKMIAMKPEAFTASNVEGVERVKRSRGRYAFLMETSNLQYFVQRNCELTQIGQPFGEKHYGLAVPLNSPFRSNLSVGILKLSEKGELYTLKNKWFNSNESCSTTSGGAVSSQFGMDSVGGLFLVLIAGVIVAFLIAIGEVVWHIERVVVKQKLPFMLVLKTELMFFVCFWLDRKPVNMYNNKKNKHKTLEDNSASIDMTSAIKGKVKKKQEQQNTQNLEEEKF